ncbi:MAG: hypothetical protein ACYTHJ_02845 [Planctomycetota bacterium]|jgi:hypothetical protein
MSRKSTFRYRLKVSLTLAMTGGSLLATTCQSRSQRAFYDSVIQLAYATVLNPQVYVSLVEDRFADGDDDNTSSGDGFGLSDLFGAE